MAADSEPDLDHIRANAAWWDSRRDDQIALAERVWTSEPTWGIFGVPEAEVRALPHDVDLIEPRPAETSTSDYAFVTVDWARQWPCEEIWRLRRL